MFTKLSKIDWTQAMIMLGAVTSLWTGLVSIIPEKYHHVGIVVIGALSGAVTFLMKSEKKPDA